MKIFNYSVNRGKIPYASEIKRKQRNLGTELCLTAGSESGDEGELTVYSINFAKASRSKEILLKKISFPLQTSPRV